MTINRIYNRITVLFLTIMLFSSIIPKSVMVGFWSMCVALSVLFCVYKRQSLKRYLNVNFAESDKIYLTFILLMGICSVYLIISPFNISKIFGREIGRLLFDKQYIIRHAFAWIQLCFPFSFGYYLFKSDIIQRVSNKCLVIAILIGFIIPSLSNYFLRVACVSLLAFRTKHKWLILFIILSNHSGSSTMLLGWLAMVFLVYTEHYSHWIMYYNTKWKIACACLILIFIIYINFDSFFSIILRDDNTLWRWHVWTNEIQSLIQTYGIGVGYGTSYVTQDIWRIVNNSNMYISEDGSLYNELFLVANHNTFLNFFYRTGVLGGLFFIMWHFSIIRTALIVYKRVRGEQKMYMWWAFVNFVYQSIIVFLNPGLEMMQFSMGFCTSVAVLLAIYMKASHQYSINYKKL